MARERKGGRKDVDGDNIAPGTKRPFPSAFVSGREISEYFRGEKTTRGTEEETFLKVLKPNGGGDKKKGHAVGAERAPRPGSKKSSPRHRDQHYRVSKDKESLAQRTLVRMRNHWGPVEKYGGK